MNTPEVVELLRVYINDHKLKELHRAAVNGEMFIFDFFEAEMHCPALMSNDGIGNPHVTLEEAIKGIDLPARPRPFAVNFQFPPQLWPDDSLEIKEGKDGKKTTIFNAKRLGDGIVRDLPVKTILGSKESYFYSDGLYHEGADDKIAEMVALRLREDFTKHKFLETLSYIKSTTQIKPDANKHGYLNLENGLLQPTTGEFRRHTPEIFCTKRMPVSYDPKADCPTFKEKLMEKVDLDVFLTFQEMCGYCLLPGQRFEKAFLLYGPPRTMKSTALFALTTMLGIENIKAYFLQTFSEDKFAPAYLHGVMANISADISARELKDTAFFMNITGQGMISASKKGQHPIDFFPDCKMIFSCNAIPSTSNKNDAFYRRWIILPFRKQTSPTNIITDLNDTIKSEAPGILNWAISGLRRLLENDGFTMRPTIDEIRDIYERGSDSITSFIYQEIVDSDEGAITKRAVFQAYKDYCKANELTPDNPILFGKRFIAIAGCGVGKKGPKGRSIPAYTGIEFKAGMSQDEVWGKYVKEDGDDNRDE